MLELGKIVSLAAIAWRINALWHMVLAKISNPLMQGRLIAFIEAEETVTSLLVEAEPHNFSLIDEVKRLKSIFKTA